MRFHAFIDTTDALNVPDQPRDLSIELEDGAGLVASARAGDNKGVPVVAVAVFSDEDAADAVAAQAQAASGQCTSFAAAAEALLPVPDGYFAVGDGPVIGQDQ